MLREIVLEHMVALALEGLSRKEEDMNPILALLAIAVGTVVGLIGAHYVFCLYRFIVRSSDKTKIKTQMLNEAYYNQLYEEALLEDINKIAKRTHRKMSKLKVKT